MRQEILRTSVVGVDEVKLREILGSLGNTVADFLRQDEITLDSIHSLALALGGARNSGEHTSRIYLALLLAQTHVSLSRDETARLAHQAAIRTMAFGA